MLLLTVSVLVMLLIIGSLACFRLSRNAALWVAASLWLLLCSLQVPDVSPCVVLRRVQYPRRSPGHYPTLLSVTHAVLGRAFWTRWQRQQ